MSGSRGDLLRWQFDLTWSLLELHLEQLKPADFLWEPVTRCWTVRPAVAGVWVPDWQEAEPEPAPIPTIAWVTWHIGWWWTVTMDYAQGRLPRDRSEIGWPGDGTAIIAWLRNLRMDWLAILDRLTDADLDAIAPFPWQRDPEKAVGASLRRSARS